LNKTFTQWVLFLVMTLILCGIFPVDHPWQPRDSFEDPVAFISHGVKQPGGFQGALPVNTGGAVAFRANLTPLPGYSFPNLRQNQPSWDRPSLDKPLLPATGFFYAILVILLFSRFYQSARGNTEGDPDGRTPMAHSFNF
jgi:hypothetical protein